MKLTGKKLFRMIWIFLISIVVLSMFAFTLAPLF